MSEIPFLSNKAQKITCESCCSTLEHEESSNTPPLYKSTTTRGGVCHARVQHPAAQTASPNADFSAARTNCHDTRQDSSGREHPNCAAFIYISQSPLPILLQELKAIMPCNPFLSANPPSITSSTSMLWIL